MGPVTNRLFIVAYISVVGVYDAATFNVEDQGVSGMLLGSSIFKIILIDFKPD